MVERFLRRDDVLNATGLSKSTLYDWMAKGRFPRNVRISDGLVVWREADIAAWQQARIANPTPAPAPRGRAVRAAKNAA